MWKDKDESWNFLQDYDPELIKEEKRKELESEIRLQVGPCALRPLPVFAIPSFFPTQNLSYF